jgi:hypothetical protein
VSNINRCFKCGVTGEETVIILTTRNASITYSLCEACAEVIGDAALEYLHTLSHPHTSWESIQVPLELFDAEEELEKMESTA